MYAYIWKLDWVDLQQSKEVASNYTVNGIFVISLESVGRPRGFGLPLGFALEQFKADWVATNKVPLLNDAMYSYKTSGHADMQASTYNTEVQWLLILERSYKGCKSKNVTECQSLAPPGWWVSWARPDSRTVQGREWLEQSHKRFVSLAEFKRLLTKVWREIDARSHFCSNTP